jgi:polysaccharide export outer membrane protein
MDGPRRPTVATRQKRPKLKEPRRVHDSVASVEWVHRMNAFEAAWCRYAAACAGGLAFLLAFVGAASADDYRLNAGDVVEISVLGMPDMRQRATVDLTGQAALPVLGRIQAAGLTLPELQRNVRDLLPTKVFRRRTDDGRDYPIVLTPEEITINVVEYRPIYLNGDVAKPGEQAYRPGMTVRQAIALAGGYDVLRFRAKDPFLESADLQSEYKSLWTEFAKEQTRLARTQAELQEKAQLEPLNIEQAPIPSSLTREIERTESQRLVTRNEDRGNEVRHLDEAIAQTKRRIAILTDLQRSEQQDADADKAEVDQARSYLQKGVVPTTRVTEARRLSGFSSTRVLQTTALIAQLEREQQDLRLRRQKVDTDRRFQLLGEAQEVQIKLASIRAKLQAVGEKLIYTGVVKSQLSRGQSGKPEITLFRRGEGSPQRLAAEEDTTLLPGDVVEVALHLEGLTDRTR